MKKSGRSGMGLVYIIIEYVLYVVCRIGFDSVTTKLSEGTSRFLREKKRSNVLLVELEALSTGYPRL